MLGTKEFDVAEDTQNILSGSQPSQRGCVQGSNWGRSKIRGLGRAEATKVGSSRILFLDQWDGSFRSNGYRIKKEFAGSVCLKALRGGTTFLFSESIEKEQCCYTMFISQNTGVEGMQNYLFPSSKVPSLSIRTKNRKNWAARRVAGEVAENLSKDLKTLSVKKNYILQWTYEEYCSFNPNPFRLIV